MLMKFITIVIIVTIIIIMVSVDSSMESSTVGTEEKSGELLNYEPPS